MSPSLVSAGGGRSLQHHSRAPSPSRQQQKSDNNETSASLAASDDTRYTIHDTRRLPASARPSLQNRENTCYTITTNNAAGRLSTMKYSGVLLGLAVLKPPGRLHVLRRRFDVERALAVILKLFGAFPAEQLVLLDPNNRKTNKNTQRIGGGGGGGAG